MQGLANESFEQAPVGVALLASASSIVSVVDVALPGNLRGLSIIGLLLIIPQVRDAKLN